MKAVMFHGKEDLRVEDIPEPELLPGKVRVRPAFAGICGSDLHFYYYPEALPFPVDQPHPLTGSKAPLVLGHEYSGTVTEVGQGVDSVRVGDRVAVFPMVTSCGECAACRSGHPFSCAKMASVGASAPGGGMAEDVVLDPAQLHVLPDSVDLKHGALVEPMAVAWHAVAQAQVPEGGAALVVGAGPIGIGAWYALRARGVEQVLVSEPNRERREAIAALGAAVVDPVNQDVASMVAELTGGDGVAAAIDAAGAEAGLLTALQVLNPGGRAVVVALHEQPVQVPLVSMMMGETQLVGAVGYTHEEFDEVIDAMARGKYDIAGWVQELPLETAEESIKALRGGTGAKVLLKVR